MAGRAGFKTGDFVKEKMGGLPQNDSYFVAVIQCSVLLVYRHANRQRSG